MLFCYLLYKGQVRNPSGETYLLLKLLDRTLTICPQFMCSQVNFLRGFEVDEREVSKEVTIIQKLQKGKIPDLPTLPLSCGSVFPSSIEQWQQQSLCFTLSLTVHLAEARSPSLFRKRLLSFFPQSFFIQAVIFFAVEEVLLSFISTISRGMKSPVPISHDIYSLA